MSTTKRSPNGSDLRKFLDEVLSRMGRMEGVIDATDAKVDQLSKDVVRQEFAAKEIERARTTIDDSSKTITELKTEVGTLNTRVGLILWGSGVIFVAVVGMLIKMLFDVKVAP